MIQQLKLPFKPSDHYFKRVKNLNKVLWFDSAGSDRFDIICAEPICHINYQYPNLVITPRCQSYQGISGCFETNNPTYYIQQIADNYKNCFGNQGGTNSENLPFVGGLAGSIDYDAFSQAREIYQTKPHQAQLDFGLYTWALVIDNQLEKATLTALSQCSTQTVQAIADRFKTEKEEAIEAFKLQQKFVPAIEKQTYTNCVEKVLDYIYSGDCYQVNFAQHFFARYSGSALNAYLHLRKQGAPFSAFMKHEKGSILSFSPERFISIANDKTISAWPIKGTASRSNNTETDVNNAVELARSPKNKAENLMIVDLLRNDLSINSQPHSVKVEALFELQSYKYVHHLVSKINATMAENSSPLNVIFDAFPGGSITGAPKRRAMQIIDDLEQSPRHIYCGSMAYFSACGKVDSNITIRTFLADNQDVLHCWGGGGIVADSNPEQEYLESLHKVQPMMQALELEYYDQD